MFGGPEFKLYIANWSPSWQLGFQQVSVYLQCLFVYLFKAHNVNHWVTINCVYPLKLFCFELIISLIFDFPFFPLLL